MVGAENVELLQNKAMHKVEIYGFRDKKKENKFKRER